MLGSVTYPLQLFSREADRPVLSIIAGASAPDHFDPLLSHRQSQLETTIRDWGLRAKTDRQRLARLLLVQRFLDLQHGLQGYIEF